MRAFALAASHAVALSYLLMEAVALLPQVLMLSLHDGIHLALAASPRESLDAALARCGPPPQGSVLALLRFAFQPDGAPPPLPLEQVLKALGPRVVALRAEVLRSALLSLAVDEYDASTRVRTVHSVPLAAYLHSRGAVLRLCPEPHLEPATSCGQLQSASEVLLLAPCAFSSNEQAAADNAFMSAPQRSPAQLVSDVLAEHASLVRLLLSAGVTVRLASHSAADGTPDALFVNNWFSTAGGMLSLFPMKCPNRRRERRPDLIDLLAQRRPQAQLVDLSACEAEAPPRFLEGTGSLVLDHLTRTAYLARSERSHEGLAREWAQRAGFTRVVAFSAADERGLPIYHTNVLLSVGTGHAVLCADCVRDGGERAALLQALRESGRRVVEISCSQMAAFCGNVLELLRSDGAPVLLMSSRAHAAFSGEQREALLGSVAELLHTPLDCIEAVGGGGVRCCIGELF